MMKNRLLKLVTFVIILFCVGYYFIPNLVHAYYKKKTIDKDIADNTEAYHELSISIMKGDGDINLNSLKKDSLYLWFHVRGLQIDEGHEGVSKAEQWLEILEYHY